MNFVESHLLSLILFFPAIAAVVILFLPSNNNKLLRWFAVRCKSCSLSSFTHCLVQIPTESARFSVRRNIRMV